MEERNNVRNDFLLPIENKQLEKLNHKDRYITSLELLEQINFFREQEGNPKTTHKDLLIIIETEFTDINRKRVEGGGVP